MLTVPQQRLPAAALLYWRVNAAVGAVVAVVVALVVLGPLWAILVLVAGAAAVVSGPLVLWRRWRYEVGDEELDLRHGLFVVRRTLVPIRRIQHVDTESGPLQSMFDLASVSVHTAAGKTTIPVLLRADAEDVRRRVSALARTRDDV